MSPTPTGYYFHSCSSVSLLTWRSRTEFLRLRLPGSVPEAPPTSTAENTYSYVSQGAGSDCMHARTHKCVRLLPEEKTTLPVQEEEPTNSQTPKKVHEQLQVPSSPRRTSESVAMGNITIQTPCPWHVCGLLSSGLTHSLMWARTMDTAREDSPSSRGPSKPSLLALGWRQLSR